MQRRTTIFIALGAAGLVGLVAVADSAFADRQRGHHGMRGGHHGMMGNQFRTMLERYDANQDGEITQEEIDQNRTQWHGEFAAGDDAITLEEFQDLWLRARNLQMVREFQRLDRDGDGRITQEEYQEPMAEFVERFDRNDDQALSRDDFQRRGKNRGDRRERNDSQSEPQNENETETETESETQTQE